MAKQTGRGKRSRRRKRGGMFLVLCLLTVGAGYLFPAPRHIPPGVDVRGPPRPVDPGQAELLFDRTAQDPLTGERVIRQEIFDTALRMIAEAEQWIYLDFFLWNGWQGIAPETHRRLSTELAEALIARKKADPDLAILALTDPINRIYGGHEEPFFFDLAAAGIPVVFTDLDRLPDSNRLYATPARRVASLLARIPGTERLLDRPLWPNLLNRRGAPITTRQLGRLLFFKANHRKVLLTDGAAKQPHLLISSFNPADGSSAHDNMGLAVRGQVALDALASELAVVEWSASRPGHVLEDRDGAWRRTVERIRAHLPPHGGDAAPAAGQPSAAWDSEAAIYRRMIELLESAAEGDEILGMAFYLSDRAIVRALLRAAAAGARVRLILDPNKDAFGMRKSGIPNRPVAAELMRAARAKYDLQIRWAATRGEQFHVKALALYNPVTGRYAITCGSANWTRRNLRNLNLEANLYLEHDPGIVSAFVKHFETAWQNDGLVYTTDYPTHSEPRLTAPLRTLRYRFQERSGLSTF